MAIETVRAECHADIPVHIPNDVTIKSSVLDACVPQVGQAKDSSLTNQLIDYLMGESDGMPKVIPPPSLLASSQWMILRCDLSSITWCLDVSDCPISCDLTLNQ